VDFGSGAYGVLVDCRDNVFVADTENHRIRKIDPQGLIISVFASDCCLLFGLFLLFLGSFVV